MRRHGAASQANGSAGETLPEPPGDGAPPEGPDGDVDIPELRKKEKERKGAGVAWSGGSPGSGSLLARAAGGATRGGPFSRLAAGIAQRVGPTGLLGRALLSRAGAWLVGAGLFGVGSALGVAVIAGLRGGLAAKPQTASFPVSLDGVSSGILIKTPKDRSLKYVSNANEGEILFDDAHPLAPKPQSSAPAEEVNAEAKMSDPPMGAEDLAGQGEGATDTPGLANKFGKLSGDNPSVVMGGLGGGGLKQGLGGFNLKTASKLPKFDASRNRVAALKRQRTLSGTKTATRRARSSRAMGQLKFARNFSSQGARTKDESSSQFATNAFEQGATQGGALSSIGEGTGGPQTVMPPGDGAPNDFGAPRPPPPVGPDTNVTPYQPDVDAAKKLGDSAGQMRMMGMMLLALGAILIALGVALMSMGEPTMTTKVIGAMLIALGAMMILGGIMMMNMGQDQAKQAKELGDKVNQQYGQPTQGEIMGDSAQAKADGADYAPPDMSQKLKPNENLKQAIDNERNSTFQLENGSGKGNVLP